jgi:hypothetical protein
MICHLRSGGHNAVRSRGRVHADPVTLRRVHAVLSAGIDNPALIARWRAEPDLLRGHGIDPSQIDLDAMWRFAGLTVKLLHNGLRDEFPASFRLIAHAGLAIELFASYASDRAARHVKLAPTLEGRTLDLLVFLEGWLDRSNCAQALLWDLIRHERALTRLGRIALALGSSADLRIAGAPIHPAADVMPRIRGEVALHEMTSDPRALAAALQSGDEVDLTAVPRARAHLCYWRSDTSPEIAILQLDKLAFSTLALVDGRHTAAELYRSLGGGRRPSAAFLQLLGELQTLGIVALRRPR